MRSFVITVLILLLIDALYKLLCAHWLLNGETDRLPERTPIAYALDALIVSTLIAWGLYVL